jgi:large subunit ribosomal protein L32e
LGLKEILVHNPQQLDGVSNVLVRMGSSVGKRKRMIIIEKANSLGLKVLNAKNKKLSGKKLNN